MKKIIDNYKFLFIYGLVIIIALLIIMFVADDKYFINEKKETAKIKETLKPTDYYQEQLDSLLNKNYDYHYSINHNGVTYKCQGTKNKEEEKGKCTEPKEIEYTNENYQEVFKDIDTNYLDVDYIYKQIKDIEPVMTNLDVKRYYTYNVNILNLKGQIIVYSDLKKITQITIVNGYLTYVLYFDNIK